jgi:hypothetical protein
VAPDAGTKKRGHGGKRGSSNGDGVGIPDDFRDSTHK